MNDNQADASEKDRRRYFRINDKLTLFYKVIEQQEIDEKTSEMESHQSQHALSQALESLEQDSQFLLRKLEKTNPEIADYLRVLENKIDLIGRAILLQGASELIQQKNRNVNISASGIAFECEEPLKEGDFLEIKMLLSSSLIIILTYAKIVHCKTIDPARKYPYLIGADYLGMKDGEKENLIKYVVKRQMQQIREHKHIS